MLSRELDHVAYSWMCHPQTWPEGRRGRRADGCNASIDIVGDKEGYKERGGDMNEGSLLWKPRQDRASYV